MESQPLFATLRTTEFWREVPDAEWAAVSMLLREEQFRPGAELFREGQEHADVHWIMSGHVRLEMTTPQRGRVALMTAGPGELLAWSALLGTNVMTSTGLALEPVRTATMSAAALREACVQRPMLGSHVMRSVALALSRRLVATRLQLLDLFSVHEPVVNPWRRTAPE